MSEPSPHTLNGGDDELFKLSAGTYSRRYLVWHVRNHGELPPEIEATLVDRTDQLMREVTARREGSPDGCGPEAGQGTPCPPARTP